MRAFRKAILAIIAAFFALLAFGTVYVDFLSPSIDGRSYFPVLTMFCFAPLAATSLGLAAGLWKPFLPVWQAALTALGGTFAFNFLFYLFMGEPGMFLDSHLLALQLTQSFAAAAATAILLAFFPTASPAKIPAREEEPR